MQSFNCPTCGQLVFVDNDRCLQCDTILAFDPPAMAVVAVASEDRRCANHQVIGCSWLVEDDEPLCRSCRLTRTMPPADDAAGQRAWADAERDKRRLVVQMTTLGLDIGGVTFDLVSSDHEAVTIGHADGVITLDVKETDDVRRTRMRQRMGEAYRTMLGHFRHEIGHYLWMELVDGTDRLESCRAMFGDDRTDYGKALEVHYDTPDPENWASNYVSVYATAHPWEDFAETMAHYFHIRGALETAGSFGIAIHGQNPVLDADPDEQRNPDMADLIDQWLPLTYALNAVNRSMGAKPLYPFVLAQPVIDKLAWVHDLVTATAGP